MAAIDAGTATQSDLTAAITASDNAAAERLWSAIGAGDVGSRAATAELRAAGDPRTVVQPQKLRAGYTAFGQTQWALTDQARFVAGMGCTPSGAKVLSLMGMVIPSERWGLGSTGKPASFKGGWGPGITPGVSDGWLERQAGILTIGRRQLAVAIASTAEDHGSGTASLTQLARWVATHVDARAVAVGSC